MDRFFGLDSVSLKDDDLELLNTANDRVYLSIIESVLKDNGIPYLVKDRGCGTVVKVVMGFSIFGADIFVLKKDFDKWKKDAQDKIKLFKQGKLEEEKLYKWMIENK